MELVLRILGMTTGFYIKNQFEVKFSQFSHKYIHFSINIGSRMLNLHIPEHPFPLPGHTMFNIQDSERVNSL